MRSEEIIIGPKKAKAEVWMMGSSGPVGPAGNGEYTVRIASSFPKKAGANGPVF
jgi:hypothetical protein